MDITAAGYLFDMDGTLVDSSAVVELVWSEFGGRFGLDPLTVLAFAHGRQAMDTVTHFLPEASDAERADIVEALLAEEVGRTDGIVEIPGAIAFLDALAEADAPVAVVTSAPRELAVARLRAAGVRIPAVLVAAEDVDRGKPDPQGYRLAAERLGVPIDACVIFEDAEAGIAAAVASGAQAVVVGEHRSPVADTLPRLSGYLGVSAVVA